LIDLGAWLTEKHTIPDDAPAVGDNPAPEDSEARER
jgi:endogenous inhibitor of DNA gyrase (YacG/DUF329 family)